MSFETSERDVLGRIGILATKTGKLETPALLPVVNPLAQEISPRSMHETLGCRALMTNAYLIRRRAGVTSVVDVHDFLDFPAVIATDSGAYQILRYGEVEVSPTEIVEYQQSIQTDIGVILDVPTGSRASRTHAMETVNETIRRADEARKAITKRDIAWVGPIQGGRYPDIIAYSAREMSQREFDIYALGSPTEVMEQYLFADLVDMILAAKTNLPANAPFHLFGAGHPFMFALAVALGCDLFDSAAYILYARRGRYLTQAGTMSLEGMRYFPCRCGACTKTNPGEVRSNSAVERTRFLAEHNLSACFRELDTIKEAIVEGRLWEILEARCRSHPSLLEALRRTKRYESYMARGAPSTKRRGIFYFDSTTLHRPEHVTYLKRLLEDYVPPSSTRTVLLIPAARRRPRANNGSTNAKFKGLSRTTHVCLYYPPYGIIPSELEDTFPLSQTESFEEPDPETLAAMVETVRTYLVKNRHYRALVLLSSDQEWQKRFAAMCRQVCRTLRVGFLTGSARKMSVGRIETLWKQKRYLDKASKMRREKRKSWG